MTEYKQQWMLNGSIPSLMTRMTLPLLPAIFLIFGFDLLESYLIAKSGTASLAALAFSAPITTAMAAIAISFSIATNSWICMTQSNDKGQLQNHIAHSLVLVSVVVMLFSIITIVCLPIIFDLLGVKYASLPDSYHMGPKPDLEPLVDEYSSIRLFGWVFLTLVWQTNGILRSLGYIKRASLLLSGWMLCKTFVAGYFICQAQQQAVPVSELGAAAYTHLTTDLVFAILSLGYLCTSLKINLSHMLSIPWKNTFRQLSNIGLSATFQQCLLPVSIALMTATVVSLGADQVAVLGVIFRIEALALLLPMALTASLPGVIAANWWAGNIDRVKSILTQAFIAILCSQLLVAAILFYQAHWISTWLTTDPQLMTNLQQYLKWVPISFVGAGCVMVTISCFNAMGWSTDASLLGFSHRIILMLSLSILGSWYAGISGLIVGMACAHGSSVIYAFYLCRRHRIQSKSNSSDPTFCTST